MQFHVVSDSHEQMVGPLKALLATLTAYGHPHPLRLSTDKPTEDKAFFLRSVPSLLQEQRRLDSLRVVEHAPPTDTSRECTINLNEEVQMASNEAGINRLVDLLRSQVDVLPVAHKVLSIDAEWEVLKNAMGQPIGRGKVALIQIGYCLADGIYRALLFKMIGLRQLPSRLLALFEDVSYTFTGRAVANDFACIEKDFGHLNLIKQSRVIDLGVHARKRDVISRGTAGLAMLVELTLGMHMCKPQSVRLGTWSSPHLSEEQQRYAAMDVTYALKVFHKLEQLPDLSARLSAANAKPGVTIDLVGSGSVAIMARRAGTGTIITPPAGVWLNPFNKKPINLTKTRRLVLISEVCPSDKVCLCLSSIATLSHCH